jgi:hypothetical protein
MHSVRKIKSLALKGQLILHLKDFTCKKKGLLKNCPVLELGLLQSCSSQAVNLIAEAKPLNP